MKKAFYASITCLCIGMIGLAAAEGAWREFYLTIMANGCLLLAVLVTIEFMFNPKKD